MRLDIMDTIGINNDYEGDIFNDEIQESDLDGSVKLASTKQLYDNNKRHDNMLFRAKPDNSKKILGFKIDDELKGLILQIL